jgi:hypothetical protein
MPSNSDTIFRHAVEFLRCFEHRVRRIRARVKREAGRLFFVLLMTTLFCVIFVLMRLVLILLFEAIYF